MEGEIAEAMEGEIAEAVEEEAVEGVGDAIEEAEKERRRLEREAHNEAARSLVLQGVAKAPVQLGDHLMEDVDKKENHPQILFDHVNEAGHAGGIQGVLFEQRIRLRPVRPEQATVRGTRLQDSPL